MSFLVVRVVELPNASSSSSPGHLSIAPSPEAPSLSILTSYSRSVSLRPLSTSRDALPDLPFPLFRQTVDAPCLLDHISPRLSEQVNYAYSSRFCFRITSQCCDSRGKETERRGSGGDATTRSTPSISEISTHKAQPPVPYLWGYRFVSPYENIGLERPTEANDESERVRNASSPPTSTFNLLTSSPPLPLSLVVTPSPRSPPSDGESSLPPLLHSESAPSLRSDFYSSDGERPRQRSCQQDGLLLCGCGNLQQ